MRKGIFALGGLALVAAAYAAQLESAQLSFLVLNLPATDVGRLPEGWQVTVNRGTPDVSVVKGPEGTYLQLRSKKSSFALERRVDVDPSQLPYLTWRWEVTELPKGADFRHSSTDDQAAQILVAFQDRRILTYIWDTTAPKGLVESASSIPLVHIFAIVCQSGTADLNKWILENRNLAQDYERAYGRKPPHVKGIRLQINSQHTGSSAESRFADVAFRATAQ